MRFADLFSHRRLSTVRSIERRFIKHLWCFNKLLTNMSRGYSVWILVALSLSGFFPVYPIPLNLGNVTKNQNTTRVLGVVTKFVGFFKLLESKLHKNSGQYPNSTSNPLGGQPWSSSGEPPTSVTPDTWNTSPEPPASPTPGDSGAAVSSTGPPSEPSPGHASEVLFGDNILPSVLQKMIDAPINMVSQCGQGLQKDGSGLCRRVW